ncbi:hypothetical protein Bca4012_063538 [Brassica carinata]
MEEIDHLADERNKAEFDVEEMKIVWAGSRHAFEAPTDLIHGVVLVNYMGNACCVAPRDKMVLLPNLPSAAAAERRHSPTWSFRWDNYNRGCVAGDDTSLSWLSDGFSRNDAPDIKSDFVSSQGSLWTALDTYIAELSGLR